ncbi:MAG TPA: glycosyltransferase family 39 protein [Thermoanaerobaculia bacterium]|nr:glycosyltransferase family 39 protein [Thermoanaerobaculia bacterium]
MSDSPVFSVRSLGAPLGWPARLLLAGAAMLVFFAGLGAYPLMEPDEGRYAEIPREMLASGDFVTPHLNGVLYFEKPPLYYWLNAAALTLPGRPEVVCRLAGVLFGLAGIGLAWALGRSVGGPRAGLASGVVLGSSPLWIALSRATIIDMTLTFFLSATLTCFWLAQEKDRGERGEKALWYGMFAASALATLAKGLIGFVIPGAVIFFYLLFARRWRILLRIPWIGGIALFLAIALPWHVLAARRNPDFLWFYFVHEHFQRYATPEAERQAPFWFFAAILALGLLPWSGAIPAAARLFRRGAGPLRDRPGLIFLACWAGFVFLFFSASQSKLVPYILPAMPPLAVLIALALAAGENAGEDPRLRSWLRVGGTVGALALAMLAAVLIWISLGRVRQVSTGVSPLLALALPTLAVCLVSAWLWLRGRLGNLAALSVAALAPALLILCLVLLGPRAARRLSAEPIARFLAGRLAPEDEVFAYRCYPQTLPVYLRRLIGLVEYRGELAFGQQHLAPEVLARRFPSVAQFRPLWTSGRTVYMVLEESKLPRLRSDGLAPGPILMRQDKYLLMTNHPPLGETR